MPCMVYYDHTKQHHTDGRQGGKEYNMKNYWHASNKEYAEQTAFYATLGMLDAMIECGEQVDPAYIKEKMMQYAIENRERLNQQFPDYADE